MFHFKIAIYLELNLMGFIILWPMYEVSVRMVSASKQAIIYYIIN